jgi:FkbM family methyltransferase
MDFGCSSGRVLRHFLTESREQGWKLTGVDVSARRIEWLRRNFPSEFQVYTGSILPVLPFESNSFDVIYGLSVFTHMKFLWDMWILELRRVLKPGGLLIQSIHTESAWTFFAQHSHEDWARAALGPMIIDQKQLPCDFVYYGNIGESQVFWTQKIAQEFWSRYLSDVKVYPPPKKYSYQDWIIGRKADNRRHTGPSSLNETVETTVNGANAVSSSEPVTSAVRTLRVREGDLRPPAIFKVEQDFSQYGEQKIILDFFSRVTSQFSRYCVDVGAYDGVIGSNSRALFLNGWGGAVVEPDPKTFARLRALYADRADITCVRRALSDQYRENVIMNFARGPANTAEEDKWKYAQVSTLHDYFAASYEKNFGYIYEPATVTTDTLTNVLREVGAPTDLGFLTIDCEGEDLKIIKELEFESFRPRLICVEADDNSRNLYSAVIEPKGYALLSYTVANAFFALKDHS